MPKAAKSETHGILLATRRPASSAEPTAQQTSCGFPAGCILSGKTTTTFASTQMPALKRVYSISVGPHPQRVSRPGKDIPSRNGNLDQEQDAAPDRLEQVI